MGLSLLVDIYSKCDRCEDGGGHCLYNAVYDVDGLASKVSFIWEQRKSFMGVILGKALFKIYF